MSIVSYNGVTLPYAHITDFQQVGVGDDLSDTDLAYTKLDVTVQCVINTAYLNLLAPDLTASGLDAAAIMRIVRARLLERRRTLSLKFNGTELVPGRTAPTGRLDARNGPIPQFCTCPQLNNSTFLLTWRVVAHYWENNTVNTSTAAVTNSDVNPVLYNRWTETQDIDNCNYSTRTRDGKFVIRSDNAQGVIADQVRTQMAVVSVPAGFLRQSAKYKVDPSGLGIEYSIVDKEVFKKPPAPAFEAQGNYIETASNGGAHRYGECRVRLKGDRATSQVLLVNTAIGVACGKLYTRGVQLIDAGFNSGGGFSIINNASLNMNLYENEVEFQVRAFIPMDGPSSKDSKGRVRTIAAFQNASDFTPYSDSDPTYTPRYLNRGTSSLLITAAAYYDPSLPDSLAAGIQRAPNALTQTGAQRQQMAVGAVPGTGGISVQES